MWTRGAGDILDSARFLFEYGLCLPSPPPSPCCSVDYSRIPLLPLPSGVCNTMARVSVGALKRSFTSGGRLCVDDSAIFEAHKKNPEGGHKMFMIGDVATGTRAILASCNLCRATLVLSSETALCGNEIYVLPERSSHFRPSSFRWKNIPHLSSWSYINSHNQVRGHRTGVQSLWS